MSSGPIAAALNTLPAEPTEMQRFTMAYPKHPSKALEAYRAYLVFRQKYGLDAQDPSVFPVDATVQQILRVYVLPYKTETVGLDVCVTHLGKATDLKAVLSGTKAQLQELERRFLVYHVHLMEHMLYLGRLQGRHAETSVMLSDMRGFGTCHVNVTLLGMLKKMSQLDDKYYPNLTQGVYLLHSPSFLRTVWTIISPLLSNTIRHRIHFAKSTVDMQSVLSASHFPQDLLPVTATTTTAVTTGWSPLLSQKQQQQPNHAHSPCYKNDSGIQATSGSSDSSNSLALSSSSSSHDPHW